MAPVVGGPLLAALGALTGIAPAGQARRPARPRLGRRRWPRSARARSSPAPTTTAPRSSPCWPWPSRCARSRRRGSASILLSAGAEESFSEGIKAFGERHFPSLPRESTFFLCLESLGSPHLLVLRGEGFLKMREYPPRSLALMDGLAEELGIWLFPEPAPAQRHRRPRAAGGRLRDGVAPGRLHRPQAAGQLPLGATTWPRTSTSSTRRRRGIRLSRGDDPAARPALVGLEIRLRARIFGSIAVRARAYP